MLCAADAAKSGVTAENVSAGLKSGQMSLQEAQQILGVEKNATLEQARKVGPLPTVTAASAAFGRHQTRQGCVSLMHN